MRDVHHTRALVVGAAVAVLVGFAPGARADTLHVTYVAGTNAWTSVLPVLASQLEPALGPTSLDGFVRFRPTGRSFTLTLDDRVVPEGRTVSVIVLQKVGTERTWQDRCLAVGASHQVRLLGPRPEVTVYIAGPTVWPSSCHAPATSGSATVAWR